MMTTRSIQKSLLAAAISAAMLAGQGNIATASSTAIDTSPSAMSSTSTVADLTRQFAELPDGASMQVGRGFVTKRQGALVVTTEAPGHKVNMSAQSTSGACTTAVTSALFAIGAAGVAALAASGGAIIAGFALSAAELSQLSALLAGGSGIYAFVAAYVC